MIVERVSLKVVILIVDLAKVKALRKNFKALQAGVEVIKQSLASVPKQQLASNVKMMAFLDSISKDLNIQRNIEHNEESKIEPDETKNSSLVVDDILTRYSLPMDEVYILKDFDKELRDGKCFTNMVEHFSNFIGTDGRRKGDILGRKMAKHILTRELLSDTSWTGISRTAGCQRKFPFRSLKNVLNLFYQVIIKADSEWTYDKTEKLFMTLLKIAKKRVMVQNEDTENKSQYETNITLDYCTPARELEKDDGSQSDDDFDIIVL